MFRRHVNRSAQLLACLSVLVLLAPGCKQDQPATAVSSPASSESVEAGTAVDPQIPSTTLDPAGAVEAGFLDRLVPEGEAIDAAVELAAELAKLPARAYAGNKLGPRQQSLQIMAASLGL